MEGDRRLTGAGSKDVGRDVARAVEVFVRGFSVAKRVEAVWVMRDAPRRNEKRYRREEWVAHGLTPPEVDAVVRRHARGSFAVCPIRGLDEPAVPLRAAYKELGYRLTGTEPLMIHRLARLPRVSSAGVAVKRVTTAPLADRLAAAAGSRRLPAEHLEADSPVRQYAALEGDAVVGWVQSIVVRLDPDAAASSASPADGAGIAPEPAAVPTSADGAVMTWCSNMYVLESHRRRGIGRALLARMLRDDRRHGAAASVLLASHAGARLYPVVGYEQIGELLAYSPRRRIDN
jgi:GNAT superfamily N-acetyltransferase